VYFCDTNVVYEKRAQLVSSNAMNNLQAIIAFTETPQVEYMKLQGSVLRGVGLSSVKLTSLLMFLL
jgi:hypothetical protein